MVTPAQISKRLHEKGVRVTAEEMLDSLMEAVERLPDVAVQPQRPERSFTVGTQVAFQQAGLDLKTGIDQQPDPLGEIVTEHAEVLTAALTVDEAAQRLGIDPTRVRHRIDGDKLYAIKVSGRWRLPIWQFTQDGLVPGVDQVIPVLPSGLHPVAVYRWMTHPSVDLEIDGQSVSPLDWLVSGGDPSEAVATAADL